MIRKSLLHDTNHKHHRRRHRTVKMFNSKCPSPNHPQLFCIVIISFCLYMLTSVTDAQQQQNFLLPNHNLENFRIPESYPIDSIVYTLKAVDRSSEGRKFSYHMTGDTFNVNEQTGEVKLVKPLDRERQSQIVVIVSVFDNSDSKNESPVETKRRTITIEDIDDSWPIFSPHKHSVLTSTIQYLYQVELTELAPINSIVISDIHVTDADDGQNADLLFECRAKLSTNSACDVFFIESRRLGSGKYSITVRTRQQLDYERLQSYRMSIIARGKRPSPLKGVPLETEAVININLINVQDEPPVFLNAPYSLSVHEGLANGTRLMHVLIQDGDSAPQRDLNVIIIPSPFSHYFQITQDEIASKVWYLETNVSIDREDPSILKAGNLFTIDLIAAEMDDKNLPIASESELKSALNDPTFSSSTMKRENIAVMVLDLPDSSPIFVQASTGQQLLNTALVVNVSESLLTGTSVPNLDLAVQDLDQGVNSRFNLSLVDSGKGPSANSAFALESQIIYGKAEVVLNVLNSTLIDYEDPELRSYQFNIVASKNMNLQMVQILEVHVNILDANDNSPEFDRDQYILEIPEGTLPGTSVATIRAKDRDSGIYGKVDYALKGHGANKFKVVSNEGKIIVDECNSSSQCLDYEVQQAYSLTYEARDKGGNTKNVSVIINIIDINDHAPKFTEAVYKRELISDNISSKQNYISPQLIVKAKDLDGPTQGRNNITYKIKSTNLTYLDVDPVSGLVYLSQPLDLDNMIARLQAPFSTRQAEKKIMFEAEVVAEDNGSPMLNSTSKIVLIVKGNPEGAPQFKQDQYQALVRENQPPNKPFFQIQAVDPDDKDSQLRYSIGYDLNDLVVINEITGELSFRVKVDYDDFNGIPYNIIIHATDNSRPYPLKTSTSVSILIQDVNDKRPKFEEYEYKSTLIQAKTRLNDVILQVKAIDTDKNAQLNYSIVEDKLTIHDRNGQLFSLEDLARSTTGYLSQMTATDRAQLVLRFKRLFEINKTTGAIELKSEPDFSFAAAVTILVRVVDLNQDIFSSSGEVQQDFVTCTFFLQTHVDKSPIFAPPWTIEKRDYNISILEELNIGTSIFSLLAKDPSTNNRIDNFEEIFESDPKDYFRVDRSGVIYINKRIDFEDLPASKKLSLSVKAITDRVTERSFYSVANLNIQLIDLNDNAPQFKSQNYSITLSESVAYPQEIVKVEALDKDSNEFGHVYYSLSGYSSEKFDIEPKKGVITLKKGQKLDRDTEPNHSFLVVASDCNDTRAFEMHDNSGCKRSSVFVNIALLDENDNDPIFINVNKNGEFEAITSETVSVGSVISQAIAIDRDEGLNGQIKFEVVRGDDEASKMLKIDREGYISVSEPFLGMGRPHPYRIAIRAFDQGRLPRQSFASLLLKISDVVSNDGVPKFIQPKPDEVVNLSENAGPNTFVYQVQAIDPDEEASGKLMYKFIQPSDVFDIDPFTGIIKTQYKPNFHLDREARSNYTLIIVAQDLGTPPKQANQVLSIRISDVNDNEPYFDRNFEDPPLVLHVQEEVPKDHLIGSIQAIDRDEGQNALIGYEILEGNQHNLFRLDSNSTEGNNPCHIYTAGRLDREVKETYTLTIKATSILKLRNSFINQLKDPLGSRSHFSTYNASDLTKIRVTIKLMDINDNQPIFTEQNAKSIVDSSAEVYSQLMVLKATDPDSMDADIQYSILDVLFYSSNSQPTQPLSLRHVFDIDAFTGILRNTVSLRAYIDGYFEVYVKADNNGLFIPLPGDEVPAQVPVNKRGDLSSCSFEHKNASIPSLEMESCFVAVTKAVIFITHQRETFKFVFNKTKLNDRLDEFKLKVQKALEEMMFEGPQAQALTSVSRSEKVFLNTFNTDFHEREDGSLDFSTLTSCSQLVKFEDRPNNQDDQVARTQFMTNTNSIVPNQVINYDEVLSLLKTLNATQMRQNKSSIFNQYGLISIERCLTDRSLYKMSLSEKAAIYFAVSIALISILLAIIVSKMRKSYEKNLKLLQRSKYQYMNQYNTLPPGLRPVHHMSTGALHGNNFIAPSYGSHIDYDGPSYDTWQL